MALRTTEEFEDALADEMGWRRTELQALRSAVNDIRPEDENRPHARMVLRSGVALSYAHWEGFAKQSCQHYLDYVAVRRLRYRELRSELIATALRSKMEKLIRDPDDLLVFASNLLDIANTRAQLPRIGVVDTGSNLRHDRLVQILTSLGVSTAPFETRETLINVRLCDARNKIAHGEYMVPSRESVIELIDLVLDMASQLRNLLETLVSTRGYRAESP